jgi:Zn-dependent protease with chaperone function
VGAWAASRHLSRQTLVHALWVVALVKLVTPPIVPLPMFPAWTLPSLGLADGPAIVVIEAGAGHKPLAANRSVLPGPSPPSGEIALARSVPTSRVETATEKRWPDPMTLAWLALVAGALAVATLAGHRIVRFRRLLCHAVPASSPLRDRVSELAARVGLRRAPEVRLLPARVPPMLWPSRRGPLLLMPEGLLPKLTSEERDTLLVHELAHVRRRDHWVRWLELAVTVVFWWYPVTWWVRRALRRGSRRRSSVSKPDSKPCMPLGSSGHDRQRTTVATTLLWRHPRRLAWDQTVVAGGASNGST